MKDQNSTPSDITRDCTHFKNYLKNQFNVENFGQFICTYTFPFHEIESLQKVAAEAGKHPVSLRLYYGCNVDGSGHKLYMSLLDEQGEIIADTGTTNDNGAGKTARSRTALPELDVNEGLMAAALDVERKCPPGGTNDRLIQSLFA